MSDVRSDMPAPPRFAQIEPMASCNLACRMCTVPQRPGGTDTRHGALAFEDFVAWIDQMPQLEELQLQGLGEPLLNPAFFEMIEYAVARGIRVTSNTNLTLLTPARAQRCVASGLAALSISLDGATAATYESIRVNANFAKLLRNIDRLVAARKRAGARRPELRFVLVLMRHNFDELPVLVELAAAHGIGEILVQRLAHPLDEPTLPKRYIPVRSYIDDAQLTIAQQQRAPAVFAAATALGERLGVRLHLPRLPSEERPPNGRCSWPWEGLYLTADGQMLPCCMVGTPDRANFGEVNGNGIASTWNGIPAQAFRAQLAGGQPPAICRSCALYHGDF